MIYRNSGFRLNILSRSILIALFAFAGCTTTKAAQNTANLSASTLNQFKLDLTAFAKEENTIQVDNQARIADLQADTNSMKAEASQITTSWQLAGDKSAPSLYAALSHTTGADVVTQSLALLQIKTGAANNASPLVSGQQFDIVVKELHAIGTNQNFTQRISAYAQFGQAVNSAYRSDVSAAQKNLASASDKQQTQVQGIKTSSNKPSINAQ